jgi:hypothetical protein
VFAIVLEDCLQGARRTEGIRDMFLGYVVNHLQDFTAITTHMTKIQIFTAVKSSNFIQTLNGFIAEVSDISGQEI